MHPFVLFFFGFAAGFFVACIPVAMWYRDLCGLHDLLRKQAANLKSQEEYMRPLYIPILSIHLRMCLLKEDLEMAARVRGLAKDLEVEL